MMHERRRQHFLREREERAIVETRDNAGVLHEVGDLLDEHAVFLQVHAPAQPPRVRLQFPRDAIAPVFVAEDHEVLRQSRLIFLEAAHLDRAPGPATRREEPMTVGQRTRFDIEDLRAGRIGGATDGEGNDAAAVQKEQPPNGSAEQQLAPSIVEFCVPMHLFRERQIPQHCSEEFREDIDRALSSLTPVIREVLPFRRRHARQILEGHALLLRKAQRRGRWLAIGAESRRYRRTADGFFEVLLSLGDLGDTSGQPTRRAVALHRRHGRDAEFIETRRQPIGKLPGQGRHPSSRKLFDTDLDQKFSIHQSTIDKSPVDHRQSTNPHSAINAQQSTDSQPSPLTNASQSRRPAAAHAGCTRCARSRRCPRSRRAG